MLVELQENLHEKEIELADLQKMKNESKQEFPEIEGKTAEIEDEIQTLEDEIDAVRKKCIRRIQILRELFDGQSSLPVAAFQPNNPEELAHEWQKKWFQKESIATENMMKGEIYQLSEEITDQQRLVKCRQYAEMFDAPDSESDDDDDYDCRRSGVTFEEAKAKLEQLEYNLREKRLQLSQYIIEQQEIFEKYLLFERSLFEELAIRQRVRNSEHLEQAAAAAKRHKP